MNSNMIKTTIQWATPFSLGLVLALAASAVLVFALLRRVAGGPLAPAKRGVLWALRGAIFAVLALILLNPVRVEETPGAIERPKVVYLVDTSQSMALGETNKTRWDQVASTARDAEAALPTSTAPQVSLFRFGNRLAAIDAPFWKRPEPAATATEGPPPAPTDSDTLLAGSLETLAGRFGQDTPRAVVVFSDGRARDPERASAIARGFSKMKVPIHVVPVGDEEVGGDVAIVSMVAPNLVRKSTQIPVQLFVRSYGYKGKRAEVKLSALGPDGRPGASLARVPVVLQDGLASYSLTFESGDQDRRIAATVDPQPGEASTDNNTFVADVAIDHTKIRVLYLEGSNEQFVTRKGLFGLGGNEVQGAFSSLQQALMEDADIEARAVIPSGPSATSPRSSGATIVVGGSRKRLPSCSPTTRSSSATSPARRLQRQIPGLARRVDRPTGRAGSAWSAGPNSFGSGRWADTLGRADAAGRDRVRAGATGTTSATALDADGRRRRSTRSGTSPPDDSQNQALAQDPARTSRVTIKLGPGQAQRRRPRPDRPGLARGREPGVAVQPYGRGRTMVMATGITRRFGGEFAQSLGAGGCPLLRRSSGGTPIYWLTENSSIGRRRRLLAETDKRLYRPGEPIVDQGPGVRRERLAHARLPGGRLDRAQILDRHAPRTTRRSASRAAPRPSSTTASPLLPWGEEFDLTKIARREGIHGLLADRRPTRTCRAASSPDPGPADRADRLREQHPGRQHGAGSSRSSTTPPSSKIRCPTTPSWSRSPATPAARSSATPGPSPRCSGTCRPPSAPRKSRPCPPGADGGCSPSWSRS